MYHELKHYEKRGVASDDKSSNATAPCFNRIKSIELMHI